MPLSSRTPLHDHARHTCSTAGWLLAVADDTLSSRRVASLLLPTAAMWLLCPLYETRGPLSPTQSNANAPILWAPIRTISSPVPLVANPPRECPSMPSWGARGAVPAFILIIWVPKPTLSYCGSNSSLWMPMPMPLRRSVETKHVRDVCFASRARRGIFQSLGWPSQSANKRKDERLTVPLPTVGSPSCSSHAHILQPLTQLTSQSVHVVTVSLVLHHFRTSHTHTTGHVLGAHMRCIGCAQQPPGMFEAHTALCMFSWLACTQQHPGMFEAPVDISWFVIGVYIQELWDCRVRQSLVLIICVS